MRSSTLPLRHVAGDIGDNPREYEYEPLTSPEPVRREQPAPARPAPAPAVPADPEKVPA